MININKSYLCSLIDNSTVGDIAGLLSEHQIDYVIYIRRSQSDELLIFAEVDRLAQANVLLGEYFKNSTIYIDPQVLDNGPLIQLEEWNAQMYLPGYFTGGRTPWFIWSPRYALFAAVFLSFFWIYILILSFMDGFDWQNICYLLVLSIFIALSLRKILGRR